ncbi:hypothetical protein [Paratractidigestivibacter sp.]|uniref:hypothetical protein n=1 Tax=Paratractidigestivibacter sp. TaxID=2847316 RepID=UPI002ABE67F4|nr:hypothetical protein [Paratractidigestivibacter sp.]
MENNTDLMPRPEGEDVLQPQLRRQPDDALAVVPDEDFSLRAKIIGCIAAALILLLSIFPAANWLSSPATYAESIAKLDAKAETVTALVGSATAASVAITLLPDDVGTPIADKLVDVAADFAIVLGAIYLEKYLLTIASLAACRVIVPLACVAFFLFMILPRREAKEKLLSLSLRLVLLAIAVAVVVPVSVCVSSLIEDTYHYDASGVAQSLGEEAQKSEEGDVSDATSDNGSSPTDSSSSDGNWFNDFIDWAGSLGQTVADAAASAANGITSGVTGALDSAKAWVSDLVEAFAVMIVTCCVIPILVLLFFVWVINLLLGLNIQVPTAAIAGAKGRLRRSARVKRVRKA